MTVQRLGICVADCRENLEQSLQPLAFYYKIQAYTTTERTASGMVLTCRPASPRVLETLHGPGTPALDERLTVVQFKLAAL